VYRSKRLGKCSRSWWRVCGGEGAEREGFKVAHLMCTGAGGWGSTARYGGGCVGGRERGWGGGEGDEKDGRGVM